MKKLLMLFIIISGTCAGIFAQSVFTEEGEASYYADKYQGSLTKSEEPYDKNKFTAAHRTLPMGTYVEVTNKANGKVVVVKINDRGPHTKNRIIDVSGIAATQLDMIRSGVAQVRLREVTMSTQAPPAAEEASVTKRETPASERKIPSAEAADAVKGQFTVQLGSFVVKDFAESRIQELSKLGFSGNMSLYEATVKGKKHYKVILGNFKDRASAAQQVQELKQWYKLDCFILTL